MGFAARGPGDPANPRPAVVIENEDAGFMGRVFLDRLGVQGLRVVSPTNAARASRRLGLPADFTRRVVEGEGVQLGLATLPDAAPEAGLMVEVRVVRALIDLNALLLEHAAAHPGQPPTEAGLSNVVAARRDLVVLRSSFAGRKPVPSGFGFSLPGNLVAYLMMNLLIFGGASVAWERRNGVLRRLSVQPLPSWAIVGGKIYGLVLLGAVQIVVMLLAGRFLFRVQLGTSLPGILLTLLVYAWVAASLGVLVGSLLRAEEKIVGVCVLASLAMAALGGCWWPLEVVPDFMKSLAHFIPTGWALDALHQLITFGSGFSRALPAVAVLAGFGLAANLAAARFFKV
jgi:ABC-type multidrug transport system permease subunit